MTEPAPAPPDAEFLRRRRGRNIAMLVLLLALSALFFAISIVKMIKPEAG